MSSSSQKKNKKSFDPKAFCRLSLARKALSTDDISARRWNLSSDQGINRSISLGDQVPSSSPDIKSLRKLASLQNHSNGSSDGDYQQEVIVGNKASSGAASLRGMKQVDQPNECSDGLQISITRKHSSVSNGVGDEAISALSELARRQSGVAPPIVLPTNKPFLVGENANRLFQRDEQKGMRVSSGEMMDQHNASPPETQRKEAPPNITILSKLLFFGGTTPNKPKTVTQPQPTFAMTPDVVQLSPDVTSVSESEHSGSNQNVEPSYLLQLGHIMGAPFPRTPIQPKPSDLDEVSSTVSSLEHFYSVAPELEECPQRPRHRFRSSFLFVAFIVSTFIILGGNEYIFEIYENTKQRTRAAYSVTLQGTKASLAQTGKDVYSKVMLKLDSCLNLHSAATDNINEYIHWDQIYIVLVRWQHLIIDTYFTIKDFLEEQANPPDQILPYKSSFEFLWEFPDEISTAVVVVNPTVLSAYSKVPLDVSELETSINGKNGEILVSQSSAKPELSNITNLNKSGLEEESGYINGSNVAEGEKEHVSTAVSSAQMHPKFNTSYLVTKDSAKNRLQAESKAKLMQAMGQKVAALLVLPRSTSFALSFTAKAAFRPQHENSFKRISAVPLAPRDLVHCEVAGKLQNTPFTELLSCPEKAVASFTPSRSICRAGEVSKIEELRAVHTDILLETEDETDFLQKPLAEVVFDFFREKRKNRRERRRKRGDT